jgi:hypothetical protein
LAADFYRPRHTLALCVAIVIENTIRELGATSWTVLQLSLFVSVASAERASRNEGDQRHKDDGEAAHFHDGTLKYF